MKPGVSGFGDDTGWGLGLSGIPHLGQLMAVWRMFSLLVD